MLPEVGPIFSTPSSSPTWTRKAQNARVGTLRLRDLPVPAPRDPARPGNRSCNDFVTGLKKPGICGLKAGSGFLGGAGDSAQVKSIADGKGHREADPAALADLVSDGSGPARFGPEIKREVEGWRDERRRVARRFYADRAELDSLGIELQVDRPGEGFEAELSLPLPPENFYLPETKFTDDELAAPALAQPAHGGRVRYAPSRCAWPCRSPGHPNPLADPDNIPVSMAVLGHRLVT